jgi:hypothetical protein
MLRLRGRESPEAQRGRRIRIQHDRDRAIPVEYRFWTGANELFETDPELSAVRTDSHRLRIEVFPRRGLRSRRQELPVPRTARGASTGRSVGSSQDFARPVGNRHRNELQEYRVEQH